MSKGYFLSQPHQPFFTLGIINAILMMLLFLLNFKGIVNFTVAPFSFHAYSLIFTVFTPFFLGFLLTTFPRFSQTPAIDKKVYSRIFSLLLGATMLFILGSFTTIMIVIIAAIMIVITQLYAGIIFYHIYQASLLQDKHDQFWILTAWSEGVAANVLFLASFLDLIPLSSFTTGVAVYLYLMLLALSVAQRMVPFFSHVMIARNKHLLKILFILFNLKVLVELFDLKVGFLFLLIAGGILAKEVIRWNLPFKQADAILWILHLAIFWLPVALIMGGFFELASLIFNKSFYALSIHLVVLGFVTTILIGFGTRVTLGHSGNQMVVDTYTKILFYLTQIVVYFRVLYSFSGSSILFDLTASLWMTLFSAWAIRYLPVLIRGKKLD